MPVFFDETGFVDRAVGDVGDHVEVFERLDQVVVGAGPQGCNRGVEGRMAGDDDDLGLRLNLLDLLQQLESVQVTHNDIGEDNRVRLLFKQLEPFLTVGSDRHIVPVIGQHL